MVNIYRQVLQSFLYLNVSRAIFAMIAYEILLGYRKFTTKTTAPQSIASAGVLV